MLLLMFACTVGQMFPDTDGDGFGSPNPVGVLQIGTPKGYVTISGDCDDTNPLVNPNAEEVCNGVDDNCNNQIDEGNPKGMIPMYADTDGDSYGADETPMSFCPGEGDQGYVTNHEDCDDSDPSIQPDAGEICDNIDNDCDGLVDQDDPEIYPSELLYADTDGDGYGNRTNQIVGCAVSGYVTDNTDCDDTDPLVNPGVTEVWYDGVDQNCDRANDNDQDGDGFIIPVDCSDTDPSINPNATEIAGDGVDSNCNNQDNM